MTTIKERTQTRTMQSLDNTGELKVYIMYHHMFPNDRWVVKCPYKWLEQNNKERVRDGEEPVSLAIFKGLFSWVESQANSNELLKEYIGETLYQEAIESELINE